jgi:hypothetical protein
MPSCGSPAGPTRPPAGRRPRPAPGREKARGAAAGARSGSPARRRGARHAPSPRRRARTGRARCEDDPRPGGREAPPPPRDPGLPGEAPGGAPDAATPALGADDGTPEQAPAGAWAGAGRGLGSPGPATSGRPATARARRSRRDLQDVTAQPLRPQPIAVFRPSRVRGGRVGGAGRGTSSARRNSLFGEKTLRWHGHALADAVLACCPRAPSSRSTGAWERRARNAPGRVTDDDEPDPVAAVLAGSGPGDGAVRDRAAPGQAGDRLAREAGARVMGAGPSPGCVEPRPFLVQRLRERSLFRAVSPARPWAPRASAGSSDRPRRRIVESLIRRTPARSLSRRRPAPNRCATPPKPASPARRDR